MILIIHTADLEKVFIGLVSKSKLVSSKTFKAKYQQAEKLLPQIDKLIKEAGYKLKDLKGIAVVNGPGPFTALRIGVVTANTLSWALKITVTAVRLSEFKDLSDLVKVASSRLKKAQQRKKGTTVKPFYGKQPNITIKKKK
ncbi:MAG: tRNA (adenosine(37)-N6)-threonylcarbamoyltransferase complex dimerization subunit type 1 TsaB [Parcubacteria group bacterium]|nr:tRNA (adenosine(37)-N6)-threonylcarbamoyltransferase complex dimerization subunit type 1 TsaB [Parcubacteria group bacterium]|tara:strand:+ start:5352 stop:5774 length:423 start_codon:yes stop_codon:yes gene_type:complete